MSNFWQRTLTGAVFIIVLIGATLLGPFSFLGLVVLVNSLALVEYCTLFRAKDYAPHGIITLVLGSLLYLSFGCYVTNASLFPIWIPGASLLLLWVPFILELYGKREHPFQRAALTTAGMLFISGSLVAFTLIPYVLAPVTDNGSLQGPPAGYNKFAVLTFFLLQWSSDTFAYLTGRAIGRTPLFPRISPKKTWEGALGGALCTAGVAFLLSSVLQWVPVRAALGMAGAIVLFGNWGDLIESMLKRSLGVKDSGNILPGHGGILDRFDSLLFASPFVLLAAILLR